MSTLSRDDAAQFFRLMWEVQFFVNQRLKLVRDPKSPQAYAKLSSKKKFKVRQALYEHPELFEAFVAENPAGLSPEELSLVAAWKGGVVGKFYIDRFLKRHTIFISAGRDERVFGVLGLFEPLDEVIPDMPLPIYVEAVLLPFKGRVVYDGILQPYDISFGAGIRADLNEIYQRAKQTGHIIETLEPSAVQAPAPKAKKPARDWGPAANELLAAAEKLRPAAGPVQARAFGVLKASARLAQAAAHDPDDAAAVDQAARRVAVALRQLEAVLERQRWA